MALTLLLPLLAYLLQNSLVSQIPFLAGVNLYALTLVLLAYRPSKIKLPFLGIYLGFFCDLAYVNYFGFYMLVYFILGLFVQVLVSYLNSNSLVSAMISGALTIFVLNLLTGILGQIFGFGLSTEFILSKAMSGTIFAHGLLAGALYILMKKLGGRKNASLLD